MNERRARIGHSDFFPPFAEVKHGKSQGLAIDILTAIANRIAIEIEWVPAPFEELHPTLDRGRAHAIFPLGITPERRELFDFGAPLLTTGAALFVRAPGVEPGGLDALSGKIVVTPRTGPLAAMIQRTAPTIKLITTASYEDSLTRLVRGEADAAALNCQVGAHIIAQLYAGQITIPRTMFAEQELGVAVSKGRGAQLLARLNDGLAAIRADGSWQHINNRWMTRLHSGTS
jgi:polar amino acid transport system substrate-binding protein